jgi:hypothetical protein
MSTLEVKGIQAPAGYKLAMPAGHILQVVTTQYTTATTWSATEILTKLVDNEISRVAAEQLLMLRIAKESVSEDERKVLQSTLKTVQAYQGAVADPAREEDISKAAKELLHLQQRNGKRVGMLMATHRRVYSELHLKTRTPSMQQELTKRR